jgi:hypothetical protein
MAHAAVTKRVGNDGSALKIGVKMGASFRGDKMSGDLRVLTSEILLLLLKDLGLSL